MDDDGFDLWAYLLKFSLCYFFVFFLLVFLVKIFFAFFCNFVLILDSAAGPLRGYLIL